MSNILEMARAHGLGPYKKAAGEYHGPCPSCGGTDRHWLKPNGGPDGTGSSGCRHCAEARCYSIDFAVRFCGVTEDEARAFYGLESYSRKQHTLESLSRQKKLPVDFLRSLGICEAEGKNAGNLEIPYYQVDGTPARSQIRSYGGNQWWNKPDARPIVPYGLDRRGTSTWLIFNEGCSDSWTFWHHGFPSLGIPGSTMHGKLTIEHLEGVDRVFVFVEDDDKGDGKGGGKIFRRNILKRLQEIGYKGRTYFVDMKTLGAKDVSALHIADPAAFPERVQKALDDADEYGDVAQPKLSLPPRPFPVDILPTEAGDAARAYAASIGCDIGFIAAPMLGVIMGAVANSFRVAIKVAWEEPACAWIAVVAQSGSGKSPGLNAAALPVYKLESEARRAYEAARVDHEQAMELWSEKPKADRGVKPTPPKRRRVRTSDPTLESLGMLLGENERGLMVIRDEGGAFLASMNQYKGGRGADVGSYVEMWGALPLVIDRKSGDVPVIYVELPNATLVIGVQPGVLSERVTPEMFESGFLARFLLVAPPEHPLRFTDADVTTEVREAYDKLIRTMYARQMVLEDAKKPEGPNTPTVLKLSPEARTLFKAFVNQNAELYGPLSGPLRSACVKLSSYATRFALAFHVADTPEGKEPGSIPEEAMDRAIRLMRWFRYEALRIYVEHGFASSAHGDRDHRLAADLPEDFTADDVAGLWGVKSSAAYDTIGRLISRGIAEDGGRGSYRRLAVDVLDLTGWTPELPELPEEEEELSGVIPVIPVIPSSGNGDSGKRKGGAAVRVWDTAEQEGRG